MSAKSASLALVHILDAIENLDSGLAQGVTAQDLDADWVRRAAVERMVEIISEASRRLPDAWKARYPALPWPQVAGIGNILRHNYEWVESRVIVGLRDDGHLARLKEAVEALLGYEEPDWRRLRAERRAASGRAGI